MRERFYRIALVLFTSWIVLVLPKLLMFATINVGPLLAAVALSGWIAVPIAAFGLWNLRPWGIWLLLIAAAMVMVQAASGGVVQFLAMSQLHIILVGLTLLRLHFKSRETRQAAAAKP
jgi:uncharacterized membrane protein (DUF2068 family)